MYTADFVRIIFLFSKFNGNKMQFIKFLYISFKSNMSYIYLTRRNLI